MLTSEAQVVAFTRRWCEQYDVKPEDVTILGSAALLFHGLVQSCDDVDLEVPEQYADQLADRIPVERRIGPFNGVDVWIAHGKLDRPVVITKTFKVASLQRLLDIYNVRPRPKDAEKIAAIQNALWLPFHPSPEERTAMNANTTTDVASRTIDDHVINPVNDTLLLQAMDVRGHGNANHVYEVSAGEYKDTIHFQNGPIAEHGVNGLTNEVLLAIVADRLKGFQAGEYACRENAIALTKTEEAMHWLQQRTLARMRRGVEGTHKK